MNSLLGSVGNSLLSSVGSGSLSGGFGGVSILMKAVGAAMRGESPQVFMKKLATQHPQLKRLNLDDLQGTADQLCKQNGLDATEVAKQVDQVIEPSINR